MLAEVRLSPKARRTVLEQLSRDRLRELTMYFDLEVTDRRSTDSYIDAIVREHSLDFRALLETPRREELQAACEALGLDASGREKAELMARILGEEPAAPKEPPTKRPQRETLLGIMPALIGRASVELPGQACVRVTMRSLGILWTAKINSV